MMVIRVDRRHFIAAIGALGVACQARVRGSDLAPHLMTVLGPVALTDTGFTLAHEHVVADLRPWSERAPVEVDRDKILRTVMPYVLQAKHLGCRTIIDCTASNLGRDPRLLQAVARKSGMHIVTTTGLYAAADQQFLPDFAKTATARRFAEMWIDEWTHGIDGSGVRPGLIKLGFNGGALTPVEINLIDAAAETHAKTGLVIGAHVGPWRVPDPGANAFSALQQLDRLESRGVDGSAYIWYHAQNEKQTEHHARAARRGAWVSFDGVAPDSIEAHVGLILNLKSSGVLDHVLVSHDAGWYTIGTKDGGAFKPYSPVFTDLIPRLRQKGFTGDEITRIFVTNPAAAYRIKTRLKAR